MTRRLLSALALGALALASSAAAQSAPKHGSTLVNGVRLAWLDYGGSGTGLVFLAGLGDSPHAYDEIAPHFTERFHVVSYARRSHGGSEARGPYDIPTLAEDLRQLLDSLGMRRAVLAGWSLGGAEIAELTARNTGRVAGVVFLDTYDLSGPAYAATLAAYPGSFNSDPRAMASVAAFRRWWKRESAPDVPWTLAMRGEVDDLYALRPDGSVRLHVTDSLQALMIGSLTAYSPRYELIRAPVLAFWARLPGAEATAGLGPDSMKRRVAEWYDHRLAPWADSVHARFLRAVPSARIVRFEHTRHSALPFQRRDAIVAEMERFFEGIPIQ